MLTALIALLVVWWVLALVFTGFLLAECVAALFAHESLTSSPVAGDTGARLALDDVVVMIPAHNEAGTISRCLESLVADDVPLASIVVTANDCDDRTAEIARAAGVTVFEYGDATRRLKARALTSALQQIAARPPRVVVFVDADSWVRPGTIRALVAAAVETDRPAQAVFLQRSPAEHPLARLSTFAFGLRNLVRPLGLMRLGGPCLLYGSGMAVPWALIRDGFVCEDDEPEDYRLTISVALRGAPPIFCPSAWVESLMPADEHAAASQRRAWAGRHLRVAVRYGAQLIRESIRRRAWWMAALALEIVMPPLSLLVAMTFVAALVSAAVAIGGHEMPLVLGATSVGMLAASIAAARLTFRAVGPAGYSGAVVPVYVARQSTAQIATLAAELRRILTRRQRN
jgi:cellulose synthase/poly-beta-1,6-N-acetylglucosamine synthase-like glycosyltransferase